MGGEGHQSSSPKLIAISGSVALGLVLMAPIAWLAVIIYFTSLAWMEQLLYDIGVSPK